MGLILGGKDKGEKGNLDGDLGKIVYQFRRCQAELVEAEIVPGNPAFDGLRLTAK